MLLWEMLEVPPTRREGESPDASPAVQHTRRLPFDMFCCAVTKSGRRCRGKVRKGSEYCIFHDPALAAKRKKTMSSPTTKRRRKLSHLPDGYLRKLTDHRSIGQAMDRLYREIRLGIITPQMGRVLFSILTRLLDSGLADLNGAPKAPSRTKAARMRPKLSELLTLAEKAAWRKAVANAPDMHGDTQTRRKKRAPSEKAIKPQRAAQGEPAILPAPVPATVPVSG